MTIAQQAADRERRLGDLRRRIQDILHAERRALSLPEIRFYLQKARIEGGDGLDGDNTFEVREAIADLRRRGVVEETIYRNVQLVGE